MNAFNSQLGDIIIYREGTDSYYPGIITQVSPNSYGVIIWKRDRAHYVRAKYGDKPGEIRRKDSVGDSSFREYGTGNTQLHNQVNNVGIASRENPDRADAVTRSP